MTVLEEIVESTRRRAEQRSKSHPVSEMKFNTSSKRRLRESIKRTSRVPVITEVKRASPSLGDIRVEVDVVQVAKMMAKGGAVGISVLTEPDYFKGKLDFIPMIRSAICLPLLRKDFIVDEYQLYESAEAGADTVLLICELLNKSLPRFVEVTKRLGMECLVEISDEAEAALAVQCRPELIGINNRELKTMKIDFSKTERLIKLIPHEVTVVSESGIWGTADVRRMVEAGVEAILVGTSIMKSKDIEGKVREFCRALEE